MKAIILAGGLGTRLQEETGIKPKPMVEIGGQPMLWHIMKIYDSFGVDQFGIAMGYKANVIRNYFTNYYYQHADMSINLRNGEINPINGNAEDWKVFLADTGINTQTGGRLKRMQPWVGEQTFCYTYGDGVADIDIKKLLAFHKQQGKIATITAVRPPSRFGGLEIEGNLVTRFIEKPQIGEGWINGGFMVLEPKVFDYIDGDDVYFERGPLESLAAEHQLAVYKHEGFWQCMDTIREMQLLESLWESGNAPWKTW